jgi:hypothetical protein
MWARLVVSRVLDLDLEGAGLKKIEGEIHSIPPDLDKLYHELIRSMGSVSLKLIQWICFATPLSLDEVRWAMVIEANSPHQSLQECQSTEDYVADSETVKRRVQTLSCGLAEVILAQDVQVVQFIHQSVKDFFLEKGLSALDSSLTSPVVAIRRAHNRLSRICIRYLAMEEIGRSTSHHHRDMMSEFSLLHYATTSWVAHTRESDDRSVPQEDLLKYFSWPSNALVELWVRIYRIVDKNSSDCPPNGTRLVHVLSRYQVVGALTAIVGRTDQPDTDIDAEDCGGRTPLSWAAEYGHQAVVKLLLNKGVNLESKDNTGRTPLSFAAVGSHEAVVKLLLNKGADLESKDNYGLTPLSWASGRRHEAIVKLLLDKGANLESKDNSGRKPLSLAAENGHETIVKLLLDRGADLESKDNSGQTPLSFAAVGSHEAVVKLLLNKGADLESRRHYRLQPLEAMRLS